MTISGGGSRATGMTTAQAVTIIQGDPSQEELFAALVTLAQSSPAQYQGALAQASVILAEQTGQAAPEAEIDAFVQQLLGQTEGADALAGGPPPPPPAVAESGFLPGLPPRIGVDPTYSAPVVGPNAAFTGRTVPGGVSTTGRYRSGDEYGWQSKSATEIRRIQRDLERAGLLESGYTPGFWDQSTANAMAGAMGYANRGGGTWEQIVDQLKSIPRDMERPQFEAPPELKPDPAAINQAVKGEFRSRLGREPTDQELAEFAGYMSGQYRSAYEGMVAQARAQFDAEIAGLDADQRAARRDELLAEGATPSELRAAGLWDVGMEQTGPGSFTDVDPNARFAETFDARFGPEMDFIEGQSDTVRNANNIFASLRNMTGLIG